MKKNTLVIGASENPARYSNLAIKNLRRNNIPVFALGLKSGIVGDVTIQQNREPLTDIHTVTLYVNPINQIPYQEYILSLKPKRVIFNPGTENEDFENTLMKNGIEAMEACTLVLLNTGQY